MLGRPEVRDCSTWLLEFGLVTRCLSILSEVLGDDGNVRLN